MFAKDIYIVQSAAAQIDSELPMIQPDQVRQIFLGTDRISFQVQAPRRELRQLLARLGLVDDQQGVQRPLQDIARHRACMQQLLPDVIRPYLLPQAQEAYQEQLINCTNPNIRFHINGTTLHVDASLSSPAESYQRYGTLAAA